MKRMFYILFLLLFICLLYSSCKKISNKSNACETDKECTELLYGLWEEHKSIFARRKFRLEFNEDGTYKEHFKSGAEDDYSIVVDSCVFYVKDKVINVEYISGGEYTTYNIKALNREYLELDEEDYDRVN